MVNDLIIVFIVVGATLNCFNIQVYQFKENNISIEMVFTSVWESGTDCWAFLEGARAGKENSRKRSCLTYLEGTGAGKTP